MNIDLACQWITRWEGKRATAYDDATGKTIAPGVLVKGIPTIAVGTNLLTASAIKAIADLGLDYGAVLTGAVSLTDQQIGYLLTIGVKDALGAIRSLCPDFDRYEESQQVVLTDIAFNMGEHRLSGFVHALAYVRAGKWISAAAEFESSAWFHQVGRRAVADTRVLAGTAQLRDFLPA